MDESWEKWLSDLEVEDCNGMDSHRYKYSYHIIATPDLGNPTLQKDSCCWKTYLTSETDSCRSSDPSFKMKDTLISVNSSPIDDTNTSLESERPEKQIKISTNRITTTPPVPAEPVKNKALAPQKPASPSKSYILSFDKQSSTPAAATETFQSTQACDLEGIRVKVGTPSSARNLQYSRSSSGVCAEPIRDTTSREKRGRNSRDSHHSKDHIMAERKRRENLSLRFIALSATIPGLKKTDKASVLGDAIRYVKQLQERVKELEEDTINRKTVSVISVKKSVVSDGDDDGSQDGHDVELPEVEARVSGKNILLRIHCLKQKGLLEKLIREIENLHLVILNSSAVPFANFIHDITIVAQKDVEYNMTMKELVEHLRLALSNVNGV